MVHTLSDYEVNNPDYGYHSNTNWPGDTSDHAIEPVLYFDPVERFAKTDDYETPPQLGDITHSNLI